MIQLRPLVSVLFVLCAAAPASRAEDALAIVHCNLIPMDGERVVADATVVVRGDRITAVGTGADVRIPHGARVIDAQGLWLLPGLTDAHVHLAHESEGLLYLRYGVTTVLNLGGDGLDLFTGDRLSVLDLRRRILAGELPGPDIVSAGTALDADPPSGPFQVAVGDVADAKRRVREQRAAGFDFVKVYDLLTPELHAAIVAAAADAGMPVFGHVPEALGLEATLRSGQHVIAHAEEYFDSFERIEEDDADEFRRLARLTRDAHVAVIPNTSFIHNVLLQLQDLDERLARPEVRFVSPTVKQLWVPRYNYLVRRDDPAAFERQMRAKYAFVQGLTSALNDEGVLLLAGSDASQPTLVPGLSLVEELENLEAAGLTRYEALSCATVNVDEFLDAHLPRAAGFGAVHVGRRANLLLVERSPFESLAHLKEVTGVVARGRWYTRAELDDALEKLAQGFER